MTSEMYNISMNGCWSKTANYIHDASTFSNAILSVDGGNMVCLILQPVFVMHICDWFAYKLCHFHAEFLVDLKRAESLKSFCNEAWFFINIIEEPRLNFIFKNLQFGVYFEKIYVFSYIYIT